MGQKAYLNTLVCQLMIHSCYESLNKEHLESREKPGSRPCSPKKQLLVHLHSFRCLPKEGLAKFTFYHTTQMAVIMVGGFFPLRYALILKSVLWLIVATRKARSRGYCPTSAPPFKIVSICCNKTSSSRPSARSSGQCRSCIAVPKNGLRQEGSETHAVA